MGRGSELHRRLVGVTLALLLTGGAIRADTVVVIPLDGDVRLRDRLVFPCNILN